MNRIDECFKSLRAQKKAAFIPFFTAGDPTLDDRWRGSRVTETNFRRKCDTGPPGGCQTAIDDLY